MFRQVDASDVAENVEASEQVDALGDDGAAGVGIAEIGLPHDDRCRGHVPRLAKPLTVDVDRKDISALCCETQSHGASDTRSRACDERNLAIEAPGPAHASLEP